MKEKRLKLIDTIFLCVCALFILTLGVFVYAAPHESFSEEENRVLSDFPAVTVRTLADGTFFERLSSFYSDRIPLRKTMIRVKAVCELASGKAQNNGVLFLSGGRLADRCEYDSLDSLDENLEGISKLCENEKTLCVFLPRSVDVYFGGELSSTVTEHVYSKEVYSEALFAKLKAASANGERVYYKTDHHLDSDGIYLLYENLLESLGVTAYKKTDFEIQTVSGDFFGSAYSSSGLLPVWRDEITLYRYENDENITVRCEDRGCELHSLYCMEKLEGKDKYAVFLGGNHGVLHITAEGVGERERLLIIKDSFANALIPLLARHFDLTVVDPRYTDEIPLGEYAATLFVFGIDTLATGKVF